MSPEVISFSSHRWSSVTKIRGLDGTSLARVRYGVGKICASECFFLDERLAHGAAKRWEREGVEPRGPETLVGLGPVSP